MFTEILERLHDRLQKGEITEEQWKDALQRLDDEDW